MTIKESVMNGVIPEGLRLSLIHILPIKMKNCLFPIA